MTIFEFQKNLDNELSLLSTELHNGQFTFGKLKVVKIPKSSGGFRTLKIPQIRDRVVIKAITKLIEPQLAKHFNLDNKVSFAYQKNKSTAGAVEKMKSLYNKEGATFIFESDIKSFFDTVNREKLLEKLVLPKLSDETINKLIRDSFQMEMGVGSNKEDNLNNNDGIPQGSSLSPLLSNVFLNQFDNELIDNNIHAVRYADDFIIMATTFEELEKSAKLAEDCIKSLGLSLNSKKTEFHKTREDLEVNKFSFLSIRFDGEKIWPEETKLKEILNKIRSITNLEDDNKNLLRVLNKLDWTLEGWLNSFAFCDVDRYFPKIDKAINIGIEHAMYKLNFKLRYDNIKVEKTDGEKKHCITESQRTASGIPQCSEIIKSIRSNKN